MTEELKPCPFCGGNASMRLYYKGLYGVRCDSCDSRVGQVFKTREDAIAAWNRRAS